MRQLNVEQGLPTGSLKTARAVQPAFGAACDAKFMERQPDCSKNDHRMQVSQQTRWHFTAFTAFAAAHCASHRSPDTIALSMHDAKAVSE